MGRWPPGVADTILERRRALVVAGYREAEVIAAWLAEAPAPDPGAVDAGLERRAARAADQATRGRVAATCG